ncbi:hypothetical protein ACFRAI_09395 [Streptomyces sp. NPDC056637]
MTRIGAVALTVGLCRLAVRGAHLLWRTRGFSRPAPELSMGEGS